MQIKPYFLLTEDDPEQAGSIQDQLTPLVPAGHTVRWIASEAAAMEWLNAIEQGSIPPPRAWIGDAMMLYSHPGTKVPKPGKAIIKEGIAKAGERLRRQARRIKAMKRVPLVFYSAIRQQTAGFTESDKIAAFMSKEEKVAAVLSKIEELELKARNLSDDDIDNMPWHDSPEVATRQLESDDEVRRSILEGMRIPWDDCKPFRLAHA